MMHVLRTFVVKKKMSLMLPSRSACAHSQISSLVEFVHRNMDWFMLICLNIEINQYSIYQQYEKGRDCVENAIHPGLVYQNIHLVNLATFGGVFRVDDFQEAWDVVKNGRDGYATNYRHCTLYVAHGGHLCVRKQLGFSPWGITTEMDIDNASGFCNTNRLTVTDPQKYYDPNGRWIPSYK